MRKASVYLDNEQADSFAHLARAEVVPRRRSSARRSPAIGPGPNGTGISLSPATSSAGSYPLPLSEKTTGLRRYAADAAAANRRAIAALRRLDPPSSLRASLGRLLNSLEESQSTYADGDSSQPNKRDTGATAQAVRLAEAGASSDALASGAPARAPHPDGDEMRRQRHGPDGNG